MKQNVKRWFGILLGLTLMLGLMVGLSATAWADSNVASVTSSGTTTEYGMFSEALNAWTGGSTLKLLQNVTHTTAISGIGGFPFLGFSDCFVRLFDFISEFVIQELIQENLRDYLVFIAIISQACAMANRLQVVDQLIGLLFDIHGPSPLKCRLGFRHPLGQSPPADQHPCSHQLAAALDACPEVHRHKASIFTGRKHICDVPDPVFLPDDQEQAGLVANLLALCVHENPLVLMGGDVQRQICFDVDGLNESGNRRSVLLEQLLPAILSELNVHTSGLEKELCGLCHAVPHGGGRIVRYLHDTASNRLR